MPSLGEAEPLAIVNWLAAEDRGERSPRHCHDSLVLRSCFLHRPHPLVSPFFGYLLFFSVA